MRTIRNKIKPEISDEQCGFVEGKVTNNAIYFLRTLSERAIEVKTDFYLCFIDYTKAFDCVKHEEVIKVLEKLNIDGKDLRIIKNMYWQQTAAIRINNCLGTFQSIKRGVQLGCVLSPDLFSIYSEYIMRSLIDGVILGQVQKFKYLGTWITSDKRCITEKRNRIGQAKTAFYKMKNILCNISLSLRVRKIILACYIHQVLTYGCESWTIGSRPNNF